MLTSTEIVERRSRIFCRDEGIHRQITRKEAKSPRATRSDIPATSVSQLRAGHASRTLLPDANFMLGSPALSNERAAPTKLGTGTTAWKTRNRSVLKGLLSFSLRRYQISGLKKDVGMIQPCARLRFAGEVPRAFFSWGIPVITQDAFHRDDAAEMALARTEDHTHSAPPNLLEDLVVPETRVGVFIRFGRGVCRDSRSQSLHLRSARPGANTGGKVRSSHGTRFHNAGTRSVGASSSHANQ
jgi:hypothetical protein